MRACNTRRKRASGTFRDTSGMVFGEAHYKQVFADACNENPQNNFNECFNSLYVSNRRITLSYEALANGTKSLVRPGIGAQHVCALLHAIQ